MTMRRFVRRARVLLLTTLMVAVPLASRAQSPRGSIETTTLFQALALQQGQTVGEIGAGAGELTIEAARSVGTQGKVLSSELGEQSVQRLKRAVQTSGLSQIEVVSGDPNMTNFPESCCDAIFMRNVYHHFADPAAMDASIARSLKPGGRVAVADFEPNRGRSEAAKAADRARTDSHGVSPTTVARELREAGLEILEVKPGEGRWFLVVATKPR
jgi:ubiquinone/menaquinone biosynthesis C-methylase UbiE